MAIIKMPTEKIIGTYFINKAIKITIMLCRNWFHTSAEVCRHRLNRLKLLCNWWLLQGHFTPGLLYSLKDERSFKSRLADQSIWSLNKVCVHTVSSQFFGSFHSLTCFIYILDSSNSSLFTFWTSQFTSSSRCNWTGISTGNSNGSWTDKHWCHFSKAKEMSVKATSFFM